MFQRSFLRLSGESSHRISKNQCVHVNPTIFIEVAKMLLAKNTKLQAKSAKRTGIKI